MIEENKNTEESIFIDSLIENGILKKNKKNELVFTFKGCFLCIQSFFVGLKAWFLRKVKRK